MAAILLVAHAPLATSLLAVARHAYPECAAGVSAVDVNAGDEPADAESRVRSALAALAPAEVLILADVFGASPCSAALAAADGMHVRVVAGVNVPMLWRTICYAGAALDELVARAVDGGIRGVMQVGASRPQNQPMPPAFDDQVQHHDQQ